MKQRSEVYHKIQQGDGEEAKISVVPASRIESLTKEGKPFNLLGKQNVNWIEVENEDEIAQLVSDPELRVDYFNRGSVLKQQAAARAHLFDEEFEEVPDVIDFREALNTKSEGTRGPRGPRDPEKTADAALAKLSPERLAALIAKHQIRVGGGASAA